MSQKGAEGMAKLSDEATVAIETLMKAHEDEIDEIKKQNKATLEEKHWKHAEKMENASHIILRLQGEKDALRHRVLVLRYRLEQVSSSAEYQVTSLNERIQIAQTEGLNARLQSMQLEHDIKAKDEEIAKLKEQLEMNELAHGVSKAL